MTPTITLSVASRTDPRYAAWALGFVWALAACGAPHTTDPTDVPVESGSVVPPDPEACAESGVICTVAGNGNRGFLGDGPATAVMMYFPTAVAMAADGTPLIVDYNNYRVRSLKEGQVATVVGNGVHAFALSGTIAAECSLENPIDLAPGLNGEFYIVEQHASRILQWGADGIVRDFAGTMGVPGNTGDGGPATSAQFSDFVTGVTAGPDGRVFIADPVHHTVRVVELDGTIQLVVGGGPGYVDGALADARLNAPHHLRWHGDALYVADQNNHAIRRIDLVAQTVNTVAGTGTAGFSGDGGPAADAQLNAPDGLDLDDDGTLYIADSLNHRIRVVALDGTISTLGGTGEAAWTGDEGPAMDATLNWPTHVTVSDDGHLYVADTLNSVVRTIGLP